MEQRTRRRVAEDRAPDVVAEVVEAEVDRRVIPKHALPEVRLPANTGVDRHAARRAPRVLRVGAEVPHVHRQVDRAAVLELLDTPHQEVGHPQPEDLAVERIAAAGARVGDEVHLPVRDVGAHGQLMVAFHQRQVVVDLVRIGVEETDGLRLSHQREPARHRDAELTRRRVVVQLRSDIVCFEEVGTRAMNRRSVEGHAKRVDHVRARYQRLAGGDRLRQVVEARRCRRQDIPRRLECRGLHVGGRHVAAEHRVIGAKLIIDAPDRLPLVAVVRPAVGNVAARDRRRRAAVSSPG